MCIMTAGLSLTWKVRDVGEGQNVGEFFDGPGKMAYVIHVVQRPLLHIFRPEVRLLLSDVSTLGQTCTMDSSVANKW